MAQLVEALRYKPESREFDSRCCHWNFSLTKSFRPHYGTGVDSASNRNERQEYLLGVKVTCVLGWQAYHIFVPIVLKSGILNLLEPSGPVQACNGIALLLHIYENISLNSSQNEICFNSRCREILQQIFYGQKRFSRQSCLLCSHVEKYGKARQATHDIITWRMRFACWINKATNAHAQIL